jgi:hypothetical protein
MLGFVLLGLAAAADPATVPASGPSATCLIVGRQLDYKAAAPGVLLVRAGGRWHRSRLPDGCPALQPNRILVRREASPRACANDLFEVRDNFRPDEFGLCRFGPFEPLPKGARF